MTPETMDQVVKVARRGWFESIDITGGAPEMHPAIGDFISRLAPFAKRLILRANLTALAKKNGNLMNLLKDLKAILNENLSTAENRDKALENKDRDPVSSKPCLIFTLPLIAVQKNL